MSTGVGVRTLGWVEFVAGDHSTLHLVVGFKPHIRQFATVEEDVVGNRDVVRPNF